MSVLDKLERRFGRFAVPHLTEVLVFGQGITFVAGLAQPSVWEQILLSRPALLSGEVWRLFTFIFSPPAGHPIFVLIALWVLWLMGRALEQHWGLFRYNVFLLVGVVMAWVAVLAIPTDVVASNVYLTMSIFLAFAYLFPNFVFYLFFILPVKVKWLGLLAVAFLGIFFVTGGWLDKALILAGVTNLLLFFGADLYRQATGGARRMKRKSESMAVRDKPMHQCFRCKTTERKDPNAEFRYYPGDVCICLDCLDQLTSEQKEKLLAGAKV